MLSQALVIISFVAVASAGVQYLADPHVGAQSEHTVRGFSGLSTVSQQHKTVASPFSSVSKSDVRVTNDAAVFAPAGVAYTQGYAAPIAAAPVAYATQAYSAAPVVAKAVAPAYAAAPVAYAAPAYAAPAYAAAPVVAKSVAPAYAAAPVAYAAPAYAAAPVVTKAVAPAYAAAPIGYAAPIAKVHSAPGLLGVAYSAVSPAVATLNFNGYGISYGY